MKNTTAFLRPLLQLVLLAALGLGMVLLFRAVSRGFQPCQMRMIILDLLEGTMRERPTVSS